MAAAATAAIVPYDRKALKAASGMGASPDAPYYTRGGPTLLSQTDADPQDNKPTKQEEREWAVLYQHCESRRQALYNWRLNWWVMWGQVARYQRPDRYYAFVESNTFDRGLRKDQLIVDRTPTICGDVCAAGLMAGLTDPDRDWLQLGPAIPGFELDQAGQQWYADVAERYNYVLTHCNFYDAQAQHYNDLTFFSTSPFIDYEDVDEILHVKVPCAGEYMLGTGFDFSDEVLLEEFRLTVSQLVEMFGVENIPPDAQRMWRQKGGALEYEYTVAHMIEPNFGIYDEASGRSIGIVPGGFTWREVFWLRGKKDARPLSRAGFHEQPFGASRWITQGNDAYGRGAPGENMLGDAIQLQLETRSYYTAMNKEIDPPMGADVSLQNLPTSTNPGNITYMNTGAGGEKKFWPLYQFKANLEAMSQNMEKVRERIALTAFNNVFQPMQNLRDETRGQVTATEVDAIKEEQLMQLGPVIGRVYGSLRQRVRRHLAIMARRGLIPRKPPSLRGIPTKIDFISMLTVAQRATRTASIARTVQFLGTAAAEWPDAKLLLDVEKAAREFNTGVGAPPDILISLRKFKQAQAAVAKQQQTAQAAAMVQAGAAAAKDLGNASTGPGTALSALVPGAGGGGPPQ